VTVLPVPVAPVISPWRLAIAGSKYSALSSVRAINKGELMIDSSIYPATIIGNLVVRRWENRHAPRTLSRAGFRRSGAG